MERNGIRLALALFALPAVCLAQEVTSFYSTTADKFVATVEDSEWEKNPEIDSFTRICPGYGGYELIFAGGDSRSWIDVKFDETKSDLYGPTMEAARGHFPNKDNDVVEWRGFLTNDSFTPYAIIYRIRASDPDDETRTFTRLLVIALEQGKSRVLGAFSEPGAEDKAHAAADRLAGAE